MTGSSDHRASGLSRRDLLKSLGLFSAAAAVGAPAPTSTVRLSARLVSEAAATPPAGSDLGAIEHIVFLMMENRSYDHYFGAYPCGRGFDDHPAGSFANFAQPYPGAKSLSPPDVLYPFHLLRNAGEECTDDLTHDWGPQHLCWNGGRMDSFVKVHTHTSSTGRPKLPAPALPAPMFSGSCSIVNQDTETGGASPDVPTVQTMPTQGGTSAPARAAVATGDEVARPRPVTLKSSYNRLAELAV